MTVYIILKDGKPVAARSNTLYEPISVKIIDIDTAAADTAAIERYERHVQEILDDNWRRPVKIEVVDP